MENNQALVKYPHAEASLRLPAAFEHRSVAPQQLSVADIYRTVARRKAFILSFTLFVLVAATAYVFLKTPRYEGVARLQIDPNRGRRVSGCRMTGTSYRRRMSTGA